EGGGESGLLDLGVVGGGIADPARDRVAVHRPPGEGFENEQVERALDDVEIGRHEGSPEVLRGTWGRGGLVSSRKASREERTEKRSLFPVRCFRSVVFGSLFSVRCFRLVVFGSSFSSRRF